MSIKDKLSRLDPSKKQTLAPVEEDRRWINAVESELQLKVIRDGNSFFLLRENYYPLFGSEFEWCIERGFPVEKLHRISGDSSGTPESLKNALFIDLETTGLAGGTGTYAFLIGLGHLELDHIVVRQYLLPDFSYEWLMLEYVEQVLQKFEHIVTFNGKSFDVPLLLSRFILNRMDSGLEDKKHLDLLHSVRRIWKRRLPACDLQTIERHILGQDRVGDIPGNLIPSLYFEFIRKRDAHILEGVLEHNFYDIVNLILLALKLSEISETPLIHLHHAEDVYCLADYYFKNNNLLESARLLEELLNGHLPIEHNLELEAFFLLSMAYKKMGNTASSKKYLWELLDRQYYHPPVVEELAKNYEHQDKDFTTALEIVEKGLTYLGAVQQLDSTKDVLKYLPQLKHRHNRLLRKLARRKSLAGSG